MESVAFVHTANGSCVSECAVSNYKGQTLLSEKRCSLLKEQRRRVDEIHNHHNIGREAPAFNKCASQAMIAAR